MSYTISLWTLMTGTTIGFKKHCKIEFGTYAEAHKKSFLQNSTQSRTEPAICLGPTVNLQGSYWFLNLRTGICIKQRIFVPFPVPMRVINRVHALADADNHNPALGFFYRLGNPIPYGDTPDDNNEDDAGDLAGVEECENQTEVPGVTTPNQEEISGVTTL